VDPWRAIRGVAMVFCTSLPARFPPSSQPPQELSTLEYERDHLVELKFLGGVDFIKKLAGSARGSNLIDLWTPSGVATGRRAKKIIDESKSNVVWSWMKANQTVFDFL